MEEKKLTGYPSIDKPWLKYYKQEHIDAPLPHMTAYEYLKMMNADRLELQAIDSDVGNLTYQEPFTVIDATAASLWKMGIKKGKKVLSMFPVLPHESFLFYGVDVVGAAARGRLIVTLQFYRCCCAFCNTPICILTLAVCLAQDQAVPAKISIYHTGGFDPHGMICRISGKVCIFMWLVALSVVLWYDKQKQEGESRL